MIDEEFEASPNWIKPSVRTLKNRLKQIVAAMYLLEQKDPWTADDWESYKDLQQEESIIKEALNKN